MDTITAVWLNGLAQHAGLRQAVVAGATYLVVVPALIAAYLAIRSVIARDAPALASLLVAAAGTVVALVVNVGATTWWYRPRPYNTLGEVHALVNRTAESSFFSDHTIAATGLAVAALLVVRRWGIVAVVCAALVAVSRVAAGAHYPTDVATAAVVTTAAIVALRPTHRRLARLIGRVLERLPARLPAAPTSSD